VIAAVFSLHFALTLASASYLLWLAWSIATSAPSGFIRSAERGRGLSLAGGFTLGAANPKVYLAFAR
jgi:threonine/homoserine/homoserine lactone efflux protein